MKNLNELYDCNYDCMVKDIKTNSKDIEKGDMFVCVKGVNEDRHNYIKDAINRGCSCLIVEKGDNYEAEIPQGYSQISEISKMKINL
jgi:UDP-N-acetylmuramoyl-L-alanyl-D-glutamate--2,6-diaminopimelate ligase